MNPMNLDDPRLADAIIRAVDRRVEERMARLLPIEQYGIVAAVDTAMMRASVYLNGSDIPSPGWVYGADTPPVIGDRVLCRRTPDGGDRLIRQIIFHTLGGSIVDAGGNPRPPVDGGNVTEPIAETQIGAEIDVDTWRRDDGAGGDESWGVETGNLRTGRSLVINSPYTVTPCPIGGGSWEGARSVFVAFTFTAPVDADYVGLRLHTELARKFHYSEGAFHTETPGVSGPYGLYGYAGDTPLPGDIAGNHATGLYLGTVMATVEHPSSAALNITIPRSGVNWGGGSRIVMVPEFPLTHSWVCDGTFPGDGWVNVSASESKVYPIGLVGGTRGLLTVAPVGTQDGVNQTFDLPWGYLAVRKVWRNGLLLPSDAYVATDGETIVMAGWAPIASDLILVELVLI